MIFYIIAEIIEIKSARSGMDRALMIGGGVRRI